MKKLNDIYSFYTINNFDSNYVYDNENYFDIISCEDYLIYILNEKQDSIKKEIKCIEFNKKKYKNYYDEILKIKKFGAYQNKTKFNKESLINIEKKLFYQNIKKPVIELNIQVNLCCSRLNGYIYKKKNEIFSKEQILKLIARLNNKNRTFFNDKAIWDSLCRVERGKVSNKLRFQIYARDGYKCKICGQDDEYKNLEIDHIKPISKGGKSTPDNLQTLCKNCNKSKDNIY